MESIGEYFQSRREDKSLSIEEIAHKTKMREYIVQQVENNNLSVLPVPYLRSFLKQYAALVGIAPEELSNLFHNNGLESNSKKHYRTQEQTNARHAASSNRETKSTKSIQFFSKPKLANIVAIRAIVFAGVILGAAVLLYYFVFRGSSSHIPNDNKAVLDTVVIKEIADELSAVITPNSVADSIILEATSSDRVWITITADNKSSWQMVIAPGEKRRWSALENFVLSFNNAGALTLVRNGSTLPSFGELGTFVRSLKITKTEIFSSANPYTAEQSAKKKTNIPEQTVKLTKQQSTETAPRKSPIGSVVQPPAKVAPPSTNKVKQALTPKTQSKPLVKKAVRPKRRLPEITDAPIKSIEVPPASKSTKKP